MFGIPMRIAKVASTDKRVQAEVDKWLKDLGSAAYARFPEGVEIDIKESNSRDSFNVFNEKRKACNEELATLIEGNFETAKDTGNLSKAEAIIQSTQKLIELDDEIRVQFFINDQVLPWLRDMGYPFDENDEFKWNYNEQATPEERLKIFKGVKELGYKVKKEQIESELDVEIEGEYQAEKTPVDGVTSARVGFNQPHAHHVGCGCGACDTTYRKIDFELLSALSNEEEKFIKEYWNNSEDINWNYNEFKASHQPLLEALQKGFGEVDFDFESSDHLTVELFRANVHRFGVDKTFQEILEMNHILKTSENYSQYRERVKRLFANYKEKWMRAEWNQAHAVAQMGAKYIQMMSDIDIAPFWRLVAVIDEGTTIICRSLHDMVFRKNDKKAWQFLPPNHWGCRSDAEDVLEGYNGEVSSFDDAVAADPEGYEKMVKAGFAVNWGEASEVFTATQNYLNNAGIEPDVLDFDFTAFGLPPFKNIQSAEILPVKTFNFNKAVDRSGAARLEDVQGMPNWISKEVFASLDEAAKKALNNILTSPDEVYWYTQNGKNFKRYIKYYKNTAFEAVVTFDKQNRTMLQKVTRLTKADNNRRGLLIYTPKEHIAYRQASYNAYSDDFIKHGFSKSNGGFIVSHVLHNANELPNNLKTAELLKSLGKKVELLAAAETKSADALVNSVTWEFKMLSSYKNLFNRIKEEIKRASKQSSNVLLHINGNYTYEEIKRGLKAGINNDKTRRVRFVGLVLNDRLFVFSRRQIQTGEFETLLKR